MSEPEQKDPVAKRLEGVLAKKTAEREAGIGESLLVSDFTAAALKAAPEELERFLSSCIR
jgi:hypothetical protein